MTADGVGVKLLRAQRDPFWSAIPTILAAAVRTISTFYWKRYDSMGLFGILAALCALIWLAFLGWSVLLLAPAAALIAAAFAGEPLLAHWTQTFMGGASRFVSQFFPIFLLGALFGKLMDDSGSVSAIANFMAEKLGPRRIRENA